MQINEISKKDFKEIKKLIKQEFPYHKITEKQYFEKIKKNNLKVFCGKQKKEVIGYIEIKFFPETTETSRINAIAVKQKFREKGFGKKLLMHAINYLKEIGIENIVLIVLKENIQALKFYKKNGFKFFRDHGKIKGKEAIELILVFEENKLIV